MLVERIIFVGRDDSRRFLANDWNNFLTGAHPLRRPDELICLRIACIGRHLPHFGSEIGEENYSILDERI